ncbi:MAG: hypothetical protein H7840_01695 [Alphaproteobacteria bacterium]
MTDQTPSFGRLVEALGASPKTRKVGSGGMADGDRRRVIGPQADLSVNPWEETRPDPAAVEDVAGEQTPGEQTPGEQTQGTREMPVEYRPLEETGEPDAAVRVEASAECQGVDVPVEDLFNGVINVLGDGLELLINGAGRAGALIGDLPDRVASTVRAGSNVVRETALRLTGRGYQIARRDDETGLE